MSGDHAKPLPGGPGRVCRHCGCSQTHACVCIDGDWLTPEQQKAQDFGERLAKGFALQTCWWIGMACCSNRSCVEKESRAE